MGPSQFPLPNGDEQAEIELSFESKAKPNEILKKSKQELGMSEEERQLGQITLKEIVVQHEDGQWILRCKADSKSIAEDKALAGERPLIRVNDAKATEGNDAAMPGTSGFHDHGPPMALKAQSMLRHCRCRIPLFIKEKKEHVSLH